MDTPELYYFDMNGNKHKWEPGGNGGNGKLKNQDAENAKDDESDDDDSYVPENIADFQRNETPTDLEKRNILKTCKTTGELAGDSRDIEIRNFIAMRLAEYCKPEDIAKVVAKHLKAEIPVKDIALINKRLSGDVTFKGRYWRTIQNIFNKRREAFLRELNQIPIANRKVRLMHLQELFEGISKDKAQTEQVPVIDGETGKQKVNRKGALVFKTVTQKTKKDVTAAAAILKQAAQEVGDWKEVVENTGDFNWASEVKKRRSQQGLSNAGQTESSEAVR